MRRIGILGLLLYLRDQTCISANLCLWTDQNHSHFNRAKYGKNVQEYTFNIHFHEDKPVYRPAIEYPKTSDPLQNEYPVVGQRIQFICKKVFRLDHSKDDSTNWIPEL